jgi:hypothetical protein
MSTRKDRLARLNPDVRDRLNYVQGLLLDAASFGDEQLYHRGRLARSLGYLFGTGTVAGLAVSYRNTNDEDEVEVSPGLCIDPLGRIIEVPQRWCVELGPWFAAQRAGDKSDGWLSEQGEPPMLVADVFVRFVECERRLSPAFASGPYDALDAVAPSRVRDGFEFALVIRTEAQERRAAIAAGPPPWPELPRPGANERWQELLEMTPEDRLAAMRADILGAWREGTEFWENDRPPRLPEHLPGDVTFDTDDPLAVGRDTTSVLLARVRIPVVAPIGAEPPARAEDEAPLIDNELRRFIYAPGILTQVQAAGGS